MACRKCGSDWTTPKGKDCSRCPHCDKQQLFQARKAGRWVEPVVVKQCACCGRDFEAIGPKQIKQRVLCGDEECAKQHRKNGFKRRAAGVYVQQQAHGVRRPDRLCKRCRKGPLERDQKDYCSRECSGADATECNRGFRGLPAQSRKAIKLAEWFYAWDKHRPGPHGRSKTYKPRPACEVCGNECNHRHSKFCSKECCKLWRGPRKCKCGKVVEHAKAYCRPSCCDCKREAKAKYRRHVKQQIGTYRKKCRKYGGYYNSSCKRRAILELDKYVCHICGRRCRNGSNFNHPMAATVDHHPVPLSQGGDHDWHNVRCCCRSCNSKKSDSWDGQRRLALSYGM